VGRVEGACSVIDVVATGAYASREGSCEASDPGPNRSNADGSPSTTSIDIDGIAPTMVIMGGGDDRCGE
jgi:hypothetical protein